MSEILEDMVAKFGAPEKIVGIVYTHFHWDHVAGGGAVVNYAKSIGQTEPVRIIGNFISRFSSNFFNYIIPLI